MTQKDAMQHFRRYQLRAIRAAEIASGTGIDAPMRRQAWVEFIDSLARDGHISESQAANWLNPF